MKKYWVILATWIVILFVLSGNSFGIQAGLIPVPKAQFVDSNGRPLSGGKLYTCKAGTTCGPLTTTNLKDTYTDSTGTSTNTNPVVLDSGGRANIWLSAGFYKTALYTSTGTLVWSIDNVSSPVSSQWNYIASGYENLDEAVASIGSTPTLLIINTSVSVVDNLIIPSTLAIMVLPGGKITVPTGKTVVINGSVWAGDSQWIYGSGTTTISTYPTNASWWGLASNFSVYKSTVASDATIGGSLAVTGNTTITGGLTVSGHTVTDDPPAGTIVMWPSSLPPTGWLECNGASLVRSSYPALYTVIGTTYGYADITHFNIPDLRGYFVRGWSHGTGVDPDTVWRTDRGDGTTGDSVGTKQATQFLWHQHAAAGSHTHTISGRLNIDHVTGSSTIYPTFDDESASMGTQTTSTAPDHQHAGNGGSESRPVNVNMMYIIKAY